MVYEELGKWLEDNQSNKLLYNLMLEGSNSCSGGEVNGYHVERGEVGLRIFKGNILKMAISSLGIREIADESKSSGNSLEIRDIKYDNFHIELAVIK